jgi:hypothetical protein
LGLALSTWPGLVICLVLPAVAILRRKRLIPGLW